MGVGAAWLFFYAPGGWRGLSLCLSAGCLIRGLLVELMSEFPGTKAEVSLPPKMERGGSARLRI